MRVYAEMIANLITGAKIQMAKWERRSVTIEEYGFQCQGKTERDQITNLTRVREGRQNNWLFSVTVECLF